MKNQGEANSKNRLFSGKGFYIAIAVSVVAIGGAAWFGVNTAMDKLKAPVDPPKNIVSAPTKTPNLEVTAPKTDVKKETAPKTETAPPEQEAKSNAVAQGYILPIKGDILNPYSGDKVVKSKTLDDWVMHTGIDIKAAVSTPVKSISSGSVIDIKNDDLWGTTITIDHGNGIVSYYANLKSAVNVKNGQSVKLGDVIGAVGDTCDIEKADGEHLHFGIKKNDNWVDPFSLIS